MTAEIAIINKNGIVMGADSTVTVGNLKTYTGVNKLFKLSNDPPMGIMIYGSAEFEGTPMETLIKEYSNTANFSKLQDIVSIKNDFVNFIALHTPNTNFDRLMNSRLKIFEKRIASEMENFNGKDLIEQLTFIVNYDLPPFLDNFGNEIEKYDEHFKNLIPEHIDKKYHTEIATGLKTLFLNDILNTGTGIVIGGFNKEDMFSSIINFEITLNYHDNDEKINKIGVIEILERLNIKGNLILPFAQTDVIYNFLKGIDEDTQITLVVYFKEIIEKFFHEIKDELNSSDEYGEEILKSMNKTLNKFNKEIDTHIEEFDSIIEKLKIEFLKPLLDSIGSLPKEDLANMAEFLINITSLKRKIDSNLESVGGDVDVSIITKGDGFIWIKQNQYYDPNLNPNTLKRFK